MLALYRSATWLVSPLLPLWLRKRQRRGKEDAKRLPERFGKASLPRPAGTLLWVHAASVGEANAALPLIEALLQMHTRLHVLLTTGTVTSAALMAKRLPPRAFHQFVPVDTPQAVRGFIRHWRPQMALFIDSELWPNLISEAHASGCVMGLVNARMSERSHKAWTRLQPFIRALLGRFTLCFAQSREDAERLAKLGICAIQHTGNLKYDVPPFAFDKTDLAALQAATANRPVWVAASTHPGEEEQIVAVHEALKPVINNLLTVIVPRHAHRGASLLPLLAPLGVAQRSAGELPGPDTGIYLADTMGELGLFYAFAQAAFIGGSLVAHGGQNPIEALKSGCPVILGPHMENFASVACAMEQENACIRVTGSAGLGKALESLLSHKNQRYALAEAGRQHAARHSGSLAAVLRAVQPYLAERRADV